MNNTKYNTKHGIYEKIRNKQCKWGHDEYLYQVLKYNKCLLLVKLSVLSFSFIICIS